jgi:hypothetical protein
MTLRFQHMITKGGNPAKNQIEVYDEEGKHFYSYNSKIATIKGDEVTLYNPYWDMFSQTTNYYLLQFLNEPSIQDIREKVVGGEYNVL